MKEIGPLLFMLTLFAVFGTVSAHRESAKVEWWETLSAEEQARIDNKLAKILTLNSGRDIIEFRDKSLVMLLSIAVADTEAKLNEEFSCRLRKHLSSNPQTVWVNRRWCQEVTAIYPVDHPHYPYAAARFLLQ